MPPFAAEQTSTAAPLAFKVNSKNVQYTDSHIIADYAYENATVTKGVDGSFTVNPTSVKYTFKTETRVPRVGYVFNGACKRIVEKIGVECDVCQRPFTFLLAKKEIFRWDCC